jgi:hypothetical protein
MKHKPQQRIWKHVGRKVWCGLMNSPRVSHVWIPVLFQTEFHGLNGLAMTQSPVSNYYQVNDLSGTSNYHHYNITDHSSQSYDYANSLGDESSEPEPPEESKYDDYYYSTSYNSLINDLSRSSSVENESWEKLRQLGKILINISS